jgi:hypothetical protein
MSGAEPEPKRDWCTLAGAEALAELVRCYWRAQGFPGVEVWTEIVRGGREPLVVVKSRHGPGGLPPASPATAGRFGRPQSGAS